MRIQARRSRGTARLAVCCLALATLAPVSGCAVTTRGRSDAKPRQVVKAPTQARSFSGWSATALRRRASRLERGIVRVGPKGTSLVGRRHRLAAVYQALSWREMRVAHGVLERALDLRQWWRNTEREALERSCRHHSARAKQWRWRALWQWLEAVHAPGSRLYGRIDEVLWSAATALINGSEAEAEARSQKPGQARRTRDGYSLLERLLRHHPRSRYVGRALVVLGQALRRQGRPVAAAATFRKVLGGPESGRYARAHLGLGRCLVDVNRPRQAMRHFVLAYGKARVGLRHDIRPALFATWAATGQSSEAYVLCRRLSAGNRGQTRALFVSLATWARDHGRPGLAADLWWRALRRWPRDPRRCGWWEEAVTGTVRLHDWHRVQGLLRRAPKLLRGLARPQPQPQNAGNRRTARCSRRIEKTLKRVATALHAKVLRQRTFTMVNTSRLAYATYARLFPGSRHAYLMASQHADLLVFMLGRKLMSSDSLRRRSAAAFDRLARRKRPPHLTVPDYRERRVQLAIAAMRAWAQITKVQSQRLTGLDRGLAGPRPCLRRRGDGSGDRSRDRSAGKRPCTK